MHVLHVTYDIVSPSTWHNRFAEGPLFTLFSVFCPSDWSAVLFSLILKEKELGKNKITAAKLHKGLVNP